MKFNHAIHIGSKCISYDSSVFIIAEAGVNHNGNIDTALKLIDVAAKAGADAVKFQSFKTEHLVLKHAEKAPYQLQTTDTEETQFSMLKNNNLPYFELLKLNGYQVEAIKWTKKEKWHECFTDCY